MPINPTALKKQANAIGYSAGVYCIYLMEDGKFKFVFYRRTPTKNIRLGATSQVNRVIERMTHYASVDRTK